LNIKELDARCRNAIGMFRLTFPIKSGYGQRDYNCPEIKVNGDCKACFGLNYGWAA